MFNKLIDFIIFTRAMATLGLFLILMSYHGIFGAAVGGFIGLTGVAIIIPIMVITSINGESKGPTLATWIATLAIMIAMFTVTKDMTLVGIKLG